MDVRLEKARAIVSMAKLRQRGGGWLVPSQERSGKGYVVTWQQNDPEGWRFTNGHEPGYRCTCADFEYRRKDCKHILAVCIVVTRDAERTDATAPDGTRTVTETVVTKVEKRTTYRQVWPAYNAAQTQEKGTFQTLLHDLCAGIPQPAHVKGRRPVTLADMVFASTFKVYSTFSGRRFMSDLKAAQTAGHIARAPHYNTIFKYLEMPELTPILTELVRQSAAPLESIETTFAIDSTGFSSVHYTRWFDHKYGDVKQAHDWKKLHAMVGTKTQIVTSVQVTHGTSSDSRELIPLVDDTARRFRMDEVSADKAYSGRKNTLAIWNHDAMPYIPYKSNTAALGTAPGAPLWRRLFHYYNLHRDEFLGRHHQRSNVESAFSMMKRKFGDAVRSKTQTAQFNEVLCKVLAHNLCCVIQSMHELGITADFAGARAA